jgi:integrase
MAIWKRKRAGGYVWMADYLDADGRRHRVSAPTRHQVDRLRAQKITERADGAALLGDPELTVEQFAQRWFARLAGSDLKPRTVADYRWLYDHYIARALGPIRLRELRRTHVKEFLNAARTHSLARARKAGATAQRTLSKNSVRLIRATLSAMLGEALDDELIKSNPAAVPSRRRGRKNNGTLSAADRHKAIRPLSDAELARVLEAARRHDPACYPLFLLLARTGARPGEAFALRWADFDFGRRKILIERAFSAGQLSTTKTDAARTVDMSRELARALGALYRAREAQALSEGSGELGDFVFTNRAGHPLDLSRIRKRFARAMKKAGVSGHRLYDLRHTFATALLAKGAPITYVAAQLGHARPTTTLQHYARWLPEGAVGFVDRLDQNQPPFWHQFGTDPSFPGDSARGERENPANSEGNLSEPSGTRTRDPLIKSQMLYLPELTARGGEHQMIAGICALGKRTSVNRSALRAAR